MANEAIFIKSGMRKLFMFSFNHHHDFIEKVWGKGNNITDHLEAKFKNHMGDSNFTSPSIIMRFIADLDQENMDKLFEYIIDNH